MPEHSTANVQRSWKVVAVTLVLIMLAIILTVPRLHVRADRRACLTRIQAFATAMQLQEAEAALRGAGGVGSPAVSAEVDRLAARYFCPTTKDPFVYLGHSDTDLPGAEKRIIAFEPLTDQHGAGGCVVYANREGAFFPAERYREVIDSLAR